MFIQIKDWFLFLVLEGELVWGVVGFGRFVGFWQVFGGGIQVGFFFVGIFSFVILVLFFIFYFLFVCWIYGVFVLSGFFVFFLLCGVVFGCLVVNVLKSYIGLGYIYLGIFVLIGVVVFLGGVVCMIISFMVILIEFMNEIIYGFFIMVILMVVKWIGDFFNKGIYDIYVGL